MERQTVIKRYVDREVVERSPFDKVIDEVISKMCTYVGVDSATIDTTKTRWFSKHSWTIEQEEDFKQWLYTQLRSNRPYRLALLNFPNRSEKSYLKRVVEQFVFSYGWKIKELKR
jgi:hypothetical protein